MVTPCFLKKMKFNLINKSEFARRAELDFERGRIQTPAFMPVGTNGTVKGLTNADLLETGSEVILGTVSYTHLTLPTKRIV